MIDDEVAGLTGLGVAHRIDEAEHARLRGDPIPPMSTVGQFRRVCAAVLRGTAAAR